MAMSTMPVGTHNGRVLSRSHGTPLRVVEAARHETAAPVVAPPGPSTATSTISPSTTMAPAAQQMRAYVVHHGDTLWSIAHRYNTTVDRMMALNTISDAKTVHVGLRLTLPETAATGTLKSRVSETASDASPADAPAPCALGNVEPARPVPPPRLRYPFRWPLEGVLTSRFGNRDGRNHEGIDIGGDTGSAIRAAADGTVAFVGTHAGYGNLTIIAHPGGLVSVYAHQQEVLVQKGQKIRAGELIGKVGTTGRTTGPHLHFEVRRGTAPVNPLQFLPP